MHAKLLTTLVFVIFCIGFSSAWFFEKAKPKAKWDSLSVSLQSLLGGKEDLPMTEREAIKKGWKKTDNKKCNEHKIFRGNRYRQRDNYGEMLIFDSNGRVAGIQAAIPTSVEMVEKRRSMMPVENGRYHLTAYFMDPKSICNAPDRKGKGVGDRLLIQTGDTWKTTMEIPMDAKDAAKNLWVKGRCIFQRGTYYWYNISKSMDCEETYPVFILYSYGKLNAFGWSIKGYFHDEKFAHPTSSYAYLAFDAKTFPQCIAKEEKTGSTQHVYLQSGGYDNCFL